MLSLHCHPDHHETAITTNIHWLCIQFCAFTWRGIACKQHCIVNVYIYRFCLWPQNSCSCIRCAHNSKPDASMCEHALCTRIHFYRFIVSTHKCTKPMYQEDKYANCAFFIDLCVLWILQYWFVQVDVVFAAAVELNRSALAISMWWWGIHYDFVWCFNHQHSSHLVGWQSISDERIRTYVLFKTGPVKCF